MILNKFVGGKKEKETSFFFSKVVGAQGRVDQKNLPNRVRQFGNLRFTISFVFCFFLDTAVFDSVFRFLI